MNKVSLDKAARFYNGRAFKPEEWQQKGLPIIRIQNLTGSSEEINYFFGDFDERNLVRRGDILISWSASLGVYIWQKQDALLNQHIFKVELKDGIEKNYFYHAATHLLNEMKSHVHGSTMQHITKDRFDVLEIPLPNPDKQKRIAAILDKADRLRRQRRFAQTLSDSFLQSVFIKMFGDPVANPMEWEKVPLSSFGNLDRGKSKHRPRNAPHLYGGPFPFVQTGDVANAMTYILSCSQYYSEEGLKQSKLWPAGTLCITIAANIAKTAILTFDACFPDSGLLKDRICLP